MDSHIQKLERTPACHCGSSLSGIKPAGLISWHFRDEGRPPRLRQHHIICSRQTSEQF